MVFTWLLWLASLTMLGAAYAQRPTTTATCGIDFDWMSNSRSQSSCLVAAYLQGACGSGAWTVPALPRSATGAQQAYLPPNATTENMCTCSSAVYNLMSACAACQGGGWLLFAPWSVACESANLLSIPGSFPAAIPVPSNTTIPGYALVDPRAWSGGGFNTTEARGVALGAVPPTLTVSTSVSGTATGIGTGSPSPSTSSPTTGGASSLPRQDNTGAIVGGVVGGILGIALVAVIMLWLFHGKRLQHRFDAHVPPSTGDNVLGRAFTTPTTPPALTNIVVPVPVRPYPLKSTFQSFMSASTTGSRSNVGDPHNPHGLTTPKTTTEGHGSDRYRTGSGMEGGGVQFSQEPPIRRTNTTSSVAHTLFRRMTSPWRRQRMTTSSLGAVTVMTSNPEDSDTGHDSRNVSRQNTTRRMAEPTPFVMPNHAEEIPTLDISSGRPTTGQEGEYYGMSASEEKRRLNRPAYVTPPVVSSGANHARVQMLERMAPTAGHSSSFLDLISGAATAGSRSNDGHGDTPPSTLPQELQSASRYRPDSKPLSLPSNLMLSSPQEIRSQDASSGMLDASPVTARPLPSNLRFVVSNPSRNVEM